MSLTLGCYSTTWFPIQPTCPLVTVCVLLLDLVVALAKFLLVLVFSLEDTLSQAHLLLQQPSSRAFPWQSFMTSFLYWSQPICNLVGSENLFLTDSSNHSSTSMTSEIPRTNFQCSNSAVTNSQPWTLFIVKYHLLFPSDPATMCSLFMYISPQLCSHLHLVYPYPHTYWISNFPN